MPNDFTNEPMLDMFLFETSQLIEQLEGNILTAEKENGFARSAINEIFRIMHTIKGSAAMMLFQGISTLAHSMEDIFYFLREENPNKLDYSMLSDLVLEGIDFIKVELEKIKNKDNADGDASELINSLHAFLSVLKQDNHFAETMEKRQENKEKQQYYISQNKVAKSSYQYSYRAVIFFEEGCEMENIRAYTIIHNLKDITDEVFYIPEDVIDNDENIDLIRREGFRIYIKSDYEYDKMMEFLRQTVFLKDLDLEQLKDEEEFRQFYKEKKEIVINNPIKVPDAVNSKSGVSVQSIISVSVTKLDKLMDLVGEMVIAEAMVIQNPDLKGLMLDNFQKAARQLNKITSEMQDMVMAIRMVPLSATFLKMNRILRDMCKKLGKEARLEIMGEETEVDKNIIEHISDPLMHLVRNALDHGLETSEERSANGKSKVGTVILEAKNEGSDVLILVKDDGKGLDKDKILNKARDQELLYKNEEDMSDKEIFNLILQPGFSTKDSVTEFSGRGVGMDVVSKNIEMIGGSVSVESTIGKGTVITMKIPLTLAIIDGMNIRVGASNYTIPTISIKESFRPQEKDIICDPDGNEMIMVRGKCYKILRLHELYQVDTTVKSFTDGIIIMVEQEEKRICIFADELLGQQQVDVKTLPNFIKKIKKITGLAGCTLLGDGSISLILDVAGLLNL